MSMNAALEHRGPDSGGQYDIGGCSLAMRRLSVIDIEGGRQPMQNEDGSLTIVFNGEIYNFQELRRKLQESGTHVFRTNSDTEVLLRLYGEHRAETPALLRGMFAFCVYDKRDDSLFFARDRYGEKPLYYSVCNGELGFSSELPSLLRWEKLPRRLDYTALYYFLNFGYVPSPLTLFEGVFQLQAGHSLRWSQKTLTISRYFNPRYVPDSALSDENAAVEALQDALKTAVTRQMIADVPLGAFLSGGIDSSTVVAAMQRQARRAVKTFTVRFQSSAYDEGIVARKVARYLGTDHHEIMISDAAFEAEDMWRILRHFGQPFSDSTAIPSYLITREIRRHATVALSGDGGDEVFAGYRYFSDALAVDRLASLPGSILSLGAGMTNLMKSLPGLRNLSIFRKASRAYDLASLPGDVRPAYMETLFTSADLNRLMTPGLAARLAKIPDTYTAQTLGEAGYTSRLRQHMHYAASYRLPEDMLTMVDRMSMANSLEVRCPLLSAEVSDLAMRLPDDLLIRGKTGKYLLREAGRKWLPEEVYARPKVGFAIPLHEFLNGQCANLCRQFLTGAKHPLIRELFRSDAVATIILQGLAVKRSNAETSVHRTSHQLWSLLQLGAWAECYDVGI